MHKIWKEPIAVLALVVSLTTCMVGARANSKTNIEGWCASYTSTGKDALHRLSITKDEKNGETKIHAWAAAFPDDIDWGEVTAEVYGDRDSTGVNFVAHFSNDKHKSMLVIVPNSGGGSPHAGGLIQCSVYEKFADGRPREFTCEYLRTETQK